MRKLMFLLPLALSACVTPSSDSVALAHQRALDAERLATFRCTFGTVAPNERQVIVTARLVFEQRYERLLLVEQKVEREEVKDATNQACGIRPNVP